jgi:UDP-N-acetylglucosamine:LPS N-acetylglucosamine transferase
MPASHQWANARAFEQLGAVEVADQATLTPDSLADRIIGLLEDPDRRDSLGQALAASMPRDAAGRIAEELLRLAPSAPRQSRAD